MNNTIFVFLGLITLLGIVFYWLNPFVFKFYDIIKKFIPLFENLLLKDCYLIFIMSKFGPNDVFSHTLYIVLTIFATVLQ